APEIAGVRAEALPAVIRLRQLLALDHGAHGAVEQHDAVRQQLLEGRARVGWHRHPRLWAKAVSTWKWGSRRSRDVTSHRSTARPLCVSHLRRVAGLKPGWTCP